MQKPYYFDTTSNWKIELKATEFYRLYMRLEWDDRCFPLMQKDFYAI